MFENNLKFKHLIILYLQNIFINIFNDILLSFMKNILLFNVEQFYNFAFVDIYFDAIIFQHFIHYVSKFKQYILKLYIIFINAKKKTR